MSKYEYKIEDCDCSLCLFYIPRNKCQLEVCCCLEEINAALTRLSIARIFEPWAPEELVPHKK